jgi:hypothetical protein
MVKLIVLIAVALLVLSFFGISLRHIISLPETQDNFHFVWQSLVSSFNLFALWLQKESSQTGIIFSQIFSFHF